MEFKDLVVARRSVRKFKDQGVASEVVERLLDVTLTAPSSKCCRSSRFMVVEDRSVIEKMAQMRDVGAAFMARAPLAIVVAGDIAASDIWEVNASISATLLQLACVDQGLGSCWVNVMDRPMLHSEPEGRKAVDHLRELLPLPEGWGVLCVVAIGYPAAEPKPLPEVEREGVVLNY